jgi:phosphopantothenate synthetase
MFSYCGPYKRLQNDLWVAISRCAENVGTDPVTHVDRITRVVGNLTAFLREEKKLILSQKQVIVEGDNKKIARLRIQGIKLTSMQSQNP